MKTLDPDLLLRAYSIGVFPMSDGRDAERSSGSSRGGGRSSRSSVSGSPARCARRSARRVPGHARHRLRRGRPAVRGARGHLDQRRDRGELHPPARGRPRPFDRGWRGRAGRRPLRRPPGRRLLRRSMFSMRDASKVALAWLVARLIVGGFRLLDCQFMTPHLESWARSRSTRRIISRCWRSAGGEGSAGAGGRAGRRRGGASVAARSSSRRSTGCSRPIRRAPACRRPDGSSRSFWARRRRSGARRR
jgi:leucyl/phenylalanyl-tRNA--protein transferase